MVGVVLALGVISQVTASAQSLHTTARRGGRTHSDTAWRLPMEAQNPSVPPPPRARKRGGWALEVHGGRLGDLLSAGARSGTSLDAFPAGTPFATAGGHPSRAVSSWFYGDGPTLFDQIRASFAASHGVSLPGIVPLDTVVRSRALSRGSTDTVGARFSRDLTSWLALEVAYDRGSSRSTLDSSVASGIEASRASYAGAFQALLTAIPHTAGQITAVAEPAATESSQPTQIATGSLVITPVRVSRFAVHVLVGGGVLKRGGSATELRLRGGTRFSLLGQMPIDESETVILRFDEKRQLPAITAGAGFTIDMWGPLGLRADARVVATEDTAVTTLSSSATHTTTVVASQQVTFPSLTTPSIQLSSIPNARTTLSGPAVADLVTYSGDGHELRPQFTVGLVLRF
jgi:hypothetical protein